MARRPIVVLTAALIVLTGCSTVDSADVRTSGLTGIVVASVPEGASYTDVDASLTVGTLTFVQLGDGEKLTASGGGKSPGDPQAPEAVVDRRDTATRLCRDVSDQPDGDQAINATPPPSHLMVAFPLPCVRPGYPLAGHHHGNRSAHR